MDGDGGSAGVAGSQPARPEGVFRRWPFPYDAPSSKVPEITLLFWILKIAGTALFAALFAICVAAALVARGGGGALVFGAALLALALLYRFTSTSRVLQFWAAFILTRPLGATVGDFLDKSRASGGLALDRFTASAVLIGSMVACLLTFAQRPARAAHGA
ncbi:MAG: hypothetical protein ISP49_08335 [Reyranella sp.]|nr:hypothetical protein [Reyranella sp.]MBL6651586.1 hypothetical protein [Reyranella sp.]